MWSFCMHFYVLTIPAAYCIWTAHSIYMQGSHALTLHKLHTVGPLALLHSALGWSYWPRDFVDMPHEPGSITGERTHEIFSLSHPRVLPAAVLNNMEHLLTVPQPTEHAQQPFLKRIFYMEEKTAFSLFFRQNKSFFGVIAYHRVEDERKSRGWFFYPTTVKKNKLSNAVLFLLCFLTQQLRTGKL